MRWLIYGITFAIVWVALPVSNLALSAVIFIGFLFIGYFILMIPSAQVKIAPPLRNFLKGAQRKLRVKHLCNRPAARVLDEILAAQRTYRPR